jgi:hypothetical protein
LPGHDKAESARPSGNHDRSAGELIWVPAPPHLSGDYQAGAYRAYCKHPLLLSSDSHMAAVRNADARRLVVGGS